MRAIKLYRYTVTDFYVLTRIFRRARTRAHLVENYSKPINASVKAIMPIRVHVAFGCSRHRTILMQSAFSVPPISTRSQHSVFLT